MPVFRSSEDRACCSSNVWTGRAAGLPTVGRGGPQGFQRLEPSPAGRPNGWRAGPMPGLYRPVPRRPPASAPRCHASCYPSPRQPSRQRSCHEFCFPPPPPHPPRQQSCHVGCCAALHAVRVRQRSRRRRRHAPCLAASSFRSASPPLTRSATRLAGCAGTINVGCSCDALCARASRPRLVIPSACAHGPPSPPAPPPSPAAPTKTTPAKLSWSLLHARRSRAFDAAHAPRQRLTQACAPGQPVG